MLFLGENAKTITNFTKKKTFKQCRNERDFTHQEDNKQAFE